MPMPKRLRLGLETIWFVETEYLETLKLRQEVGAYDIQYGFEARE